MRVVENAYAKINWSLDVLNLRKDGYHALDMIMQCIDLKDILTLEPAAELSLAIDGQDMIPDENNLILRAARALCAHTLSKHGARIYLQKNIPIGAGLGGGSSDCAAALRGLNTLWNLGLSLETLTQIGATLGSDVPFLMQRQPARVQGRGEIIRRIRLPDHLPMVVHWPNVKLSTPRVFAQWDLMGALSMSIDMDKAQSALATGDMNAFAGYAGNALEKAAVSLAPEIAQIRDRFYQLGAVFSQMSGSGSAVFAVFNDEHNAKIAKDALGENAALTCTLS